MRRGGIGPVGQLPRRPNPTHCFPASPEMQRPTRLQHPWEGTGMGYPSSPPAGLPRGSRHPRPGEPKPPRSGARRAL